MYDEHLLSCDGQDNEFQKVLPDGAVWYDDIGRIYDVAFWGDSFGNDIKGVEYENSVFYDDSDAMVTWKIDIWWEYRMIVMIMNELLIQKVTFSNYEPQNPNF